MSVLDFIVDLLAGGKHRRLQSALAKLRGAFAAPSGVTPDRHAACYGKALRLALRIDPHQAVLLLRTYDNRIPADHYVRAFSPADAAWLGPLVQRDDREVLTVGVEVANRLGLAPLRDEAASRLAGVLARSADADRFVLHLARCRQLGSLGAEALASALRDYLVRAPFARDAATWSSFFATIPESMLPDMFEVHEFLGRGADAVRLAGTPAQLQAAMACCARSPRLGDVRAGLDRAGEAGDAKEVRHFQELVGDLLFGAGGYEEALAEYRAAGREAKVSECHERLGRPFEALACCPADRGDRMTRLAAACVPLVNALVDRGEFREAARQAQGLVIHLGRCTDAAAVAERRAEADALRAGVLAVGRGHFGRLAQQADNSNPSYEAWSHFEEEAGEVARAAELAEDAGDPLRAHRLYLRAEQFGEAVRVLQADTTPEGLTRQAEARAAGDDPAGAARLYEKAGRPEEAARCYARAADFASAARCLRRQRGDEAVESRELEDWLLRAGQIEELVALCTRAVDVKGRGTRAAEILRRLADGAAGQLPPRAAADARAALDRLGLRGRGAFEERSQAWAAQARAEVERRYAGLWALDLGTTTCSVAVYDTQAGLPVLCPWRGRDLFASTLSIDEQGNELVGLTGEEIFAHQLVGHIHSAKRNMGTTRVYKVRERGYRPEEVAARLIRHARTVLEGFLADQVRQRVRELARAALGEVDDDWLAWAERHHDLRLSRPRAVVTMPAYFTNNQKHATRDACAIAGVEVARLMHEPTAACLFAGRSRRLTGRVVVVDLGAGTLDVSALDVAEGVYEVEQVLGDNRYGGNDFDAAIVATLAERLRQREGIEVPPAGLDRKRLEVTAECLKVELSGQEHAAFVLHGFASGRDVRLELSRGELGAILADPLHKLRETCRRFKAELIAAPQHLVLVGGPMLSPLVSGVVEEVFGMKRTVLDDPRTAVARGAALQAAVLDGKLKETLLLDVTPLPLGIRAFDDKDREHFSRLVDRNERIPLQKRQTYSTKEDNQPAIDVEVFQGDLAAEAKIGHFRLDGIPPAKKGVPQLEVTFAIDANCVLEVTARDKGTGKSNSIRISDTTLLSPAERAAMAKRFGEQQEQERRRQELKGLLEGLAQQVESAIGADGEALLREWRSRMEAYSKASAPPNPSADRALFEMFNTGRDVEAELLLAGVPLRDLAAKAREYLARSAVLPPESLPTILTEGQHLAAELDNYLNRLRPLRDKVAVWNALLRELATAETDLLRRFLACYEAGDHARALEALAGLPAPPDHPAHVAKHLDCLGRVGDAEGYRRALAPHAERLAAVPIDRARPEAFLARARPALARVEAALPDGGHGVAGGFLVSDRLVATNLHWFGPDAVTGAIEVVVCGAPNRVERVFRPHGQQALVALLRLAEPVGATPFRIGYPGLVRIGDPLWAVMPPGAEGEAGQLCEGVVNRLEAFGKELRLFQVGLALPPVCGGGPLFNDLGEVVGVLALRQQATRGSFAVMADGLAPLLAAAGFNPRSG